MILKIIEGAWDKPFSDNAAAIWSRALADLPFEAAQQAVLLLVRTHKYRPSIAEIRQTVFELVDPLPTAEEAWEEARRAARTFSPYHGGVLHEWSHPLIERAARVVGIETMAYSEEPTVIAAQFRRVYENLREREQIRRQQEAFRLPSPSTPALTDSGTDVWGTSPTRSHEVLVMREEDATKHSVLRGGLRNDCA